MKDYVVERNVDVALYSLNLTKGQEDSTKYGGQNKDSILCTNYHQKIFKKI